MRERKRATYIERKDGGKREGEREREREAMTTKNEYIFFIFEIISPCNSQLFRSNIETSNN